MLQIWLHIHNIKQPFETLFDTHTTYDEKIFLLCVNKYHIVILTCNLYRYCRYLVLGKQSLITFPTTFATQNATTFL